jgi:hypothetical protein
MKSYGIVKRNEEAEKNFEEAKLKEQTACLAKVLPEAPELIVVKVGRIPSRKEVLVTCYFHQIIEMEDLSWKFFLPNHVVPRAIYMGDPSKYITQGTHLKGMPMGDIDYKSRKLRERYWKEAVKSYKFKSKHAWHLQVNIDSPTKITR